MNEKIMKQEAHYDWLKDEVHCLYAEKKELQERIEKAIEYIESKEEEHINDYDEHYMDDYLDDYDEHLLDILKGSDKNVN